MVLPVIFSAKIGREKIYFDRVGPGIFSGCRELIHQAVRAGFLQGPGHSRAGSVRWGGAGVVGRGRTRGPV